MFDPRAVGKALTKLFIAAVVAIPVAGVGGAALAYHYGKEAGKNETCAAPKTPGE